MMRFRALSSFCWYSIRMSIARCSESLSLDLSSVGDTGLAKLKWVPIIILVGREIGLAVLLRRFEAFMGEGPLKTAVAVAIVEARTAA